MNQLLTTTTPYIEVFVEDLLRANENVRKKHTKESIANMAASIKRRGIINAPCIINEEHSYRVVAGGLRMLGAKAAGLEKIICKDVTHLTEAERIEVSLSENIDRAPMSALQCYRAFTELWNKGRNVDDIADQFNLEVKEIAQYLAIGQLPAKLLNEAENDDTLERSLPMLTTASPQQIKEYTAMKKRPPTWKLKEWIRGNDGWFPKSSLIEPELYDGPTTVDLFDDDQTEYCTDGALFWRIQNESVAIAKKEYEKRGWKVTKVDHFSTYSFTKTAKKDGGEVFYTLSPNTGKAEFHVGYSLPSARRRQAESKTKAPGETTEKPAISKDFQVYCEDLRHTEVQLALHKDTSAALRAVLFLFLTHADNFQFARTGYRTRKEDLSQSLEGSDNAHTVHLAHAQLLEQLSVTDRWNIDHRKLAEAIADTTIEQVKKAIAICVAAQWIPNASSTASDTFAIGTLGLQTVEHWQHDEAFWNGISNKQTLLDILKPYINVAPHEKATLKVLRQLAAANVPADWRPAWLMYPDAT